MKNTKLWLVASLILVALLVPLALRAQTPDVPPYPQPPVILSTEDAEKYASDATPTPDPEQAKHLPYEEPPIIATLQVVDLAPKMDSELKYEIHVHSGKTGETLIVLIPRNIENEEEVIKKYVHEDEGDTYRRIIPPGILK